MQAVIKELQETAIVMSGTQARQAEVLKGHGEWLEEQQASIARHEQWLSMHEAAWAQHELMMARHDRVMAEIEDKLNGLIGFADGIENRKPE